MYDKREILLRDRSFPIYAAKRCVIEPGFQKQVEARVQIPDYHPTIQGSSVAWIKTNYTGYPLQSVVTDYVANITMVNFLNHTDDKHTIHKGQLLGYLDLRSKDGSLVDLQWFIPLGTDTNKYVFYGHTAFVSALAQQHLAEEEQYKQNYNRLEIRNESNKLRYQKRPKKQKTLFHG